MTHDNLQEDQEQHQAYRDYLARTFGPEVLVGLATDSPSTSHRSAQRHVQDRNQALRDHQHDQDVELVAVAAREQDEDEALEVVLRKMRRGGGRVPQGSMANARRALLRRGYHQGSTAERLARMGQGQGWRSS
jgi:SOS response regulatory protein OraA/RecX